MIRVVSLSPAIDITYELPEVRLGESLRVSRVFKTPGGKGINVARILHSGGHPVQLVVTLGGQSGYWIERELLRQQLTVTRLAIEAETRSCVAVITTQATVLNEPAAEITDSEVGMLLALLEKPSQTSVLSGSLPPNLTEQQIAKIVHALRASSGQLIVDTTGPGLLIAASAGADLLKPNREEAVAATKASSAEMGAVQLIELGAKGVLLSNGAEGAELIRKGTRLRASTRITSGNATGAGDAMVAMAAVALSEGASDEILLRNAVAGGSLAVTEQIAGVIDWGQIEVTAAEVEVV